MHVEHFTNKNLSVVVEKFWFLAFVVRVPVRQYFCVQHLLQVCNLDLDNQIFDCVLTSMAAMCTLSCLWQLWVI